ncbi:MAG: hypothetical protein MHMPM18_000955 [Marteilia pararefringens]
MCKMIMIQFVVLRFIIMIFSNNQSQDSEIGNNPEDTAASNLLTNIIEPDEEITCSFYLSNDEEFDSNSNSNVLIGSTKLSYSKIEDKRVDVFRYNIDGINSFDAIYLHALFQSTKSNSTNFIAERKIRFDKIMKSEQPKKYLMSKSATVSKPVLQRAFPTILEANFVFLDEKLPQNPFPLIMMDTTDIIDGSNQYFPPFIIHNSWHAFRDNYIDINTHYNDLKLQISFKDISTFRFSLFLIDDFRNSAILPSGAIQSYRMMMRDSTLVSFVALNIFLALHMIAIALYCFKYLKHGSPKADNKHFLLFSIANQIILLNYLLTFEDICPIFVIEPAVFMILNIWTLMKHFDEPSIFYQLIDEIIDKISNNCSSIVFLVLILTMYSAYSLFAFQYLSWMHFLAEQLFITSILSRFIRVPLTKFKGLAISNMRGIFREVEIIDLSAIVLTFFVHSCTPLKVLFVAHLISNKIVNKID